MNESFCYCTLALKPKYQVFARDLAKDLEIYSPGTTLVVGTDNPSTFQDSKNIFAFKHQKSGILHCYNDKRFVIGMALSKFKTAIQIDADTRLDGHLPSSVHLPTGIGAIHVESLVGHVSRYTPWQTSVFYKLADKLDVDLDSVSYIGESLFSISGGDDRGADFIHYWDIIARYLELRGIHAGEGSAIGLAAAKVGLEIFKSPSWLKDISRVRKHSRASGSKTQERSWNKINRKAVYHYRLNRARLIACKDFNFYYR